MDGVFWRINLNKFFDALSSFCKLQFLRAGSYFCQKNKTNIFDRLIYDFVSLWINLGALSREIFYAWPKDSYL